MSVTAPPAPHFSSIATRIGPKGIFFTDFLVSAPPSGDHPKGTLVALGFRWAAGADDAWTRGVVPESGLFLVEIDLASTLPVAALPVSTNAARLVRADSGLVMAVQEKNELDLLWLDGARAVRTRRRVPRLCSSSGFELSTFAALRDRFVVVGAMHPGPVASVPVVVLDSDGHVIATHRCSGGDGPRGSVAVEAWGDRALLRLWDSPKTPVCAFRLEPGAPTIQASFPESSWVETAGNELRLHLYPEDGSELVQPLGDDLRPRGRPRPYVGDAPAQPLVVVEAKRAAGLPSRCSGITGTEIESQMWVEGLLVVETNACCGDGFQAGLFVCDPGLPATKADGGT
jgi:hypothetical protein